MKRLSILSLFVLLATSNCQVYHYSKVVPGETVVFHDNSTVSSAGNNEMSAATTSYTPAAVAASNVADNGAEDNESSYNPGPLTQEINVAEAQAQAQNAPDESNNGAPSWIHRQAYDEIERGRQVFYGVGFTYYQAPTKKELDKAKAKAESSATDRLTNYVTKNLNNVAVPLEGVTVAETWQDLEQMAMYTLVRYVNK